MSPLDYFTAVGGFASISGLAYALYLSKHSRKAKSFVYEVSRPVPIATAVSPGRDSRLCVLLYQKGKTERKIASAYVRFLRFANLGRESIRGQDVAPSNPLRMIGSAAKILDVSLDHQSREVNNVTLSNLPCQSGDFAASVAFDFLDRDDGATIRILTEGDEGDFVMDGDIIGMPRGISRGKELSVPTWTSNLGCALGIAAQACSFAVFAFIYYRSTGSFDRFWLPGLAVLSVFMPIPISILMTRSLWPHFRARLPDSIALPHWYKALRTYHYGLIFEEADPERIRQQIARESDGPRA